MGTGKTVFFIFLIGFAVDFALHRFIIEHPIPKPKEAKPDASSANSEADPKSEKEEVYTEDDLDDDPQADDDDDDSVEPKPDSEEDPLLDEDSTVEEEKPKKASSKAKSKRVSAHGVSVLIQLCQQCGFMKRFKEIEEYLGLKYRGLQLESMAYPLPPVQQYLSYGVIALQIVICVFIMNGPWAFQKIGMPLPSWYETVNKHKFMFLIALYFGGNYLRSSLTATNAFEVYVNGELEWSRISKGGNFMPSNSTMSKLVNSHLATK
eukprot:TRINITY_DN447_c0_g1_i1.p2 TRINITY_DN447_c0_g1~~TRINITY_DN447_c0_g1_i1.p2  ORF type:complete len:264 (+),score=32.65 TRINITY_DN447_c0_g1_i1:2-793(+)